MKTFLPFLLLLFFFSAHLSAQPQVELRPWKSGFNQPLGIVHAGDDRLFIVEQRGLIKIIDGDENVLETPFLDLSDQVSQSGFERGLLGLAFHPDYSENGYFFVNYTRQSDGNTVVSRFSVGDNNPDAADPESEIQLFTVDQPFSNHNGGQLLFGPDGYLYIALGDGGSAGDPQNNAQDLTTMLGKMLRIDVEVDEDGGYSIPDDNPFVNDANALDEIWAYGLRNPWRNSFDRLTGDFWIGDVGQNEREEINLQEAGSTGGENYGWRCYEGNLAYNTDGCPGEEKVVFPVYDYPHAVSGCTGSVTGGYVYRGAMYNGLFGEYLFADYCTGKLYHISPTAEGFEGEELGEYDATEYTTFGEDRHGELYIALSGAGEINKVVETGDCKPVAFIPGNDEPREITADETLTVEAVYYPSLEYQWQKDGVALTGETSYLLEIAAEGNYTVTVTNPGNGCESTSEVLEVSLVPTSANLNETGKIEVFPNPVTNHLHIKVLSSDSENRIRLFNSKGAVVFSENSKSNKLSVSTRNFPAGIYLLRITSDSDLFTKKIIVKQE